MKMFQFQISLGSMWRIVLMFNSEGTAEEKRKVLYTERIQIIQRNKNLEPMFYQNLFNRTNSEMTWVLDVENNFTIIIIHMFKLLQENMAKWVNEYGHVNYKTETIEILNLKYRITKI